MRDSYFQKIQQAGWVSKNRVQFVHPRIAERILQVLNMHDVTNRGAPVGQLLADVLIRSQAGSDRLGTIRRHAQYGNLPGAQALLEKFYNRLVEREREHQIPLDLIHTGRASQYRRQDHLEQADRELDKVMSQGPLWRYERAYIRLLNGNASNLIEAENILKPDCLGDLTDDSFRNRGLYAKILARQGRLQEAYDGLETLFKQTHEFFREDAKRWVVSVASHRFEFGAGLVVHGAMSQEEFFQRFEELQHVLSNEKVLIDYSWSDRPWEHLNNALLYAVQRRAEGTSENA